MVEEEEKVADIVPRGVLNEDEVIVDDEDTARASVSLDINELRTTVKTTLKDKRGEKIAASKMTKKKQML